MELPQTWKPVGGISLIRVGPTSDGGYVIGKTALNQTRRLVSGGLFDDWRFEIDFHARTGCKVDMYDASVTLKFWAKRYYYYLRAMPSGETRPSDLLRYFQYRNFFKKNGISHHRAFLSYADWATGIADILGTDANADTFLKIDIEGSEYRILSDLLIHQAAISGFVIEFHDVDLHLERISRFIDEASTWFRVEHVHANNYGGFAPGGLATAIEISFGRVNASLETDATLPARSYPVAGLDFPNNPAVPDPAIFFV